MQLEWSNLVICTKKPCFSFQVVIDKNSLTGGASLYRVFTSIHHLLFFVRMLKELKTTDRTGSWCEGAPPCIFKIIKAGVVGNCCWSWQLASTSQKYLPTCIPFCWRRICLVTFQIDLWLNMIIRYWSLKLSKTTVTSTEIFSSAHKGSKDQRHKVEESRKSDCSTPQTLRSRGEGGGQITTRGGVSRNDTTCQDTLIRARRDIMYLRLEISESFWVQLRDWRHLLWTEAAA